MHANCVLIKWMKLSDAHYGSVTIKPSFFLCNLVKPEAENKTKLTDE